MGGGGGYGAPNDGGWKQSQRKQHAAARFIGEAATKNAAMEEAAAARCGGWRGRGTDGADAMERMLWSGGDGVEAMERRRWSGGDGTEAMERRGEGAASGEAMERCHATNYCNT